MLLEQLRDGKGGERGDERCALLEHVAAVEDRPHDRRIGRRPADAAVLERLDEAGLGVAGGRTRLVAFGYELLGVQGLADRERRHLALGLVLPGLVPARLVRQSVAR